MILILKRTCFLVKKCSSKLYFKKSEVSECLVISSYIRSSYKNADELERLCSSEHGEVCNQKIIFAAANANQEELHSKFI